MSRIILGENVNDVLFRTANVAYGTIQWANGLDIDPEWLYEDSVPV